jgi:membrane protease subunit (stomatin/prohibitin family)
MTMGLWDKIRGEFIDIVEWLDSTRDTMVFRFDRHENEIKYGAKLVVRESQSAVFVNEGKLADVFGPGTYSLETKNIPILTTLKGWKYGFASPFKAEVYFVSTRLFTDLKWGTKNPVMIRDPEFGPARVRAFGTYVVRVKDPAALIRQVAGTEGRFTTGEINEQLRNFIVTRFADLLGESKTAVLDLASKYNELGEFVTEKLKPEFEVYGLELQKLLVENISLPAEVEAAMDKRTSMGVVGNLDAYARFQAANSIPDAARNPGGLAAAGVGLGMGVSMAGQFAQAMPAPGTPPPVPAAAQFFIAQEGKQAGPFNLDALGREAQAGRLTKETLVWKQGMAAWTPASQVAEVSGILGGVPPPLPPRS